MPEAVEMINLAFLSESERERILEVLQRDEELRQAEEQRVRKLKTELLDIRRKGAKRSGEKYSERSCGRCLEPIGRLAASSSQCRACKHQVCRNCRSGPPNGSWVCSVCSKEASLKKSTGDWFYDQKINRFFTTPGYSLVRASLKKRPLPNKRETVGEALLNRTEINPKQPIPTARPRLKNPAATKGEPDGNSQSCGLVGSVETIEHVDQHQQRSDTESAEKASLCSVKTGTESAHGTPDPPKKEKTNVRSSPVPVQADSLSIHSSISDAAPLARSSPTPSFNSLEVDGLFKKSVKRVSKNSEFTSVLDLRQEVVETSEVSMGDRSKSVPGLNFQDDEEEDEDIDDLVNIHKKTVASSASSLRSSRSTLGSLMSIYSESGDYDSVEVSGDIVFSLSYDEHTQTLNVHIKECHELAHGDVSRQRSNPYVKCYLLPDKSRQSKKKTGTKRNTLSPTYNETLKYTISRSELQTRSLLISVWHHGRLSRNAFLGEVEVSLDCRDLDSIQEERLPLMGKSSSPVQASAFAQYKGDLVVSLKYVTATKPPSDKTRSKKAKNEEGGELHVWIKEAKSLSAMKAGGTSDSFVKGYLLPAKAKSTKRKTPVMKKTLNPHYDHTFVYEKLNPEQLRDMCLELTVWDREAMSSNDFLGGVRLSTGMGTLKVGKEEIEMDSVGEEVSLWQKMMQYPDSWAEGTLPLRSSMGKTSGK